MFSVDSPNRAVGKQSNKENHNIVRSRGHIELQKHPSESITPSIHMAKTKGGGGAQMGVAKAQGNNTRIENSELLLTIKSCKFLKIWQRYDENKDTRPV